MKALALSLLVFLALGMMVAPALAQAPAGSSGSSTQTTPPASNPGTDVKSDNRVPQPGASTARQPDVNINAQKDTTARSDRSDDGSALPRGAASGVRTSVFGLSPTAAVIVGAALLVVVILAIVAMTRSGETTYIDRGRGL
jgi:hypothetical protein